MCTRKDVLINNSLFYFIERYFCKIEYDFSMNGGIWQKVTRSVKFKRCRKKWTNVTTTVSRVILAHNFFRLSIRTNSYFAKSKIPSDTFVNLFKKKERKICLV